MNHALISNFHHHPRTHIREQRIVEAVCAHFAIDHADLFTRSRRPPLPYVRQIAMYIASVRGMGPVAIGRFLQKDHTTAIYGIATIKGFLEVNSGTTRQDVEAILTALSSR